MASLLPPDKGRFRPEDYVGLALAVAVHVGVIAWLLLRPAAPPPPPPSRMEVTLSDDTGLHATSPNPGAAAAVAQRASTPGEAQPMPQPQSEPQPQPIPQPEHAPSQPIVHPRPEPVERKAPAQRVKAHPAPRAEPEPRPEPARPSPHAPARPERSHEAREKAARPPASASADPIGAVVAAAHRPSRQKDAASGSPPPPGHAPKSHRPEGGDPFGAAFMKGIRGGKAATAASGKPGSAPGSAGPAVKAALGDAVSRQLHAHWVAPQGADAEKLVTVVTWELKPDGTLAGPPRVVRQEGIDASNKPQAALHAERAIKAIRLCEPFQLPPAYYGEWKHLTWHFDRSLSQ